MHREAIASIEHAESEFDADIAAIFGEEATELLEQSEAAFSRWRRDRADGSQVTELKRLLHTLKGGARMAGIRAMGDVSHEVESLLEAVENGTVHADGAAFDVLQDSLDELHRMRELANFGQGIPVPAALLVRIREVAGHRAAPARFEPLSYLRRRPRRAPLRLTRPKRPPRRLNRRESLDVSESSEHVVQHEVVATGDSPVAEPDLVADDSPGAIETGRASTPDVDHLAPAAADTGSGVSPAPGGTGRDDPQCRTTRNRARVLRAARANAADRALPDSAGPPPITPRVTCRRSCPAAKHRSWRSGRKWRASMRSCSTTC